MALYSLPSLRSNVCDWAGPPFIHSRMHDLCLAPAAACSAARAASTLNHPDTDAPRTPAAVSFSASRRVKPCLLEPNMIFSFGGARGWGLGAREKADASSVVRSPGPR